MHTVSQKIYFLSVYLVFPLQRTEVRPCVARPFSVVVAIDFGTTSSGYAFSFTEDPETIHMMRYDISTQTLSNLKLF
uniref:Uncharacterized protein n=1 Tax=Sinocyclocheilus anshuiensis TaxID=1608454 RepID=A0A671Q7R8_9TELE